MCFTLIQAERCVVGIQVASVWRTAEFLLLHRVYNLSLQKRYKEDNDILLSMPLWNISSSTVHALVHTRRPILQRPLATWLGCGQVHITHWSM